METSVFSIGIGFIILLLDLWAIASVWRTRKPTGTKLGWAVVIFVLPLVGFVIWAISGPRGIVKGPTSSEHSKG